MFITNTENYNDEKLEVIGLVSGSCVQSVHLGKDILQGLKNMVGGELKSYNKMMSESRDKAIERLIENAEEMGADGVINVRISTSAIVQAAAEILVYGTAVKIKE